MTKEEAIDFGKMWLELQEDSKGSNTYEFFKIAIQTLEQEPCEEAISRQAVIDMLEDINAETEGVGFYYEHYVEYIKKLPPVRPQEPKWIPVNERLPENNEDVLVYDDSDIFVAWYSGIDFNWCSADNRFDEYTPIIAWQPLPKPGK